MIEFLEHAGLIVGGFITFWMGYAFHWRFSGRRLNPFHTGSFIIIGGKKFKISKVQERQIREDLKGKL